MNIQYSLNQGKSPNNVDHESEFTIREFHLTVKERVANYFKENNIVSLSL